MNFCFGSDAEIRACPLHVCFIPKPGRFGAPTELSEKGQIRTFAYYDHDSAHCSSLTSQSSRAVSLCCAAKLGALAFMSKK